MCGFKLHAQLINLKKKKLMRYSKKQKVANEEINTTGHEI